MKATEEYEFVRQLACELADGNISLPSLPAVALKIRSLMEDESCNFEMVSRVVSVDPALVSRLGLDVVRNAAFIIAVKQLLFAKEHRGIFNYVREIWRGVRGFLRCPLRWQDNTEKLTRRPRSCVVCSTKLASYIS